jgi:hypothetical protein
MAGDLRIARLFAGERRGFVRRGLSRIQLLRARHFQEARRPAHLCFLRTLAIRHWPDKVRTHRLRRGDILSRPDGAQKAHRLIPLRQKPRRDLVVHLRPDPQAAILVRELVILRLPGQLITA